MRNIRRTVATFGVAALVAFGAVGCADSDGNGAGGDAGAAPVTEAADPKVTLAKAAAELGKTSFKMTADLGLSGKMTGAMDPPNNRATLSTTFAAEGVEAKIENRVLGTELYSKMDMGGAALPGMDPNTWNRLDMEKLPENNSLGLRPGEFDPAGSTKFLRAVATAERVDDQRIKGTMDLTKAVGAAGIEAKDVESAGAKGKAMPFEATIDDEGRLAKLVLDLPAMTGEPAQKFSVTYSDFGAPVEVSKPTGKIAEAPEWLYGTFGA
jgi:hypothetical protein